jgi:hypothetical protein
VCDDGEYRIYDRGSQQVKIIEGYVPGFMCPNGGGYGDYVVMEIDETGKIQGWNAERVVDSMNEEE